ncbi:MAG: extensin family protein [Aestuariivirgaceae bacterium]
MSTVKLCDLESTRVSTTLSGLAWRRWQAAVAAILSLAVTTTAALPAGDTPVPRPKPVIKAAVSRPAGKVPLPRPKPTSRKGVLKDDQSAKPPVQIQANRRGQLEVKLDKLGRERNPDKASNLRPKTKSKWSKQQVAEAVSRCAIVLATTNLNAKPIDPIGGPDGCGIAAPIRITSFGAVTVKPAAKLNCTMAAALYKWVTDAVQPAARKSFKQPIVEIRNLASYQCRARNGVAGGRISEHSFGNALDIGAFKLANGQQLTVLDDWSSTMAFFGVNAKAKFLTRSHKGACKLFSTVLGPKANKAHENHFHFDLGRDGRYRICK